MGTRDTKFKGVDKKVDEIAQGSQGMYECRILKSESRKGKH